MSEKEKMIAGEMYFPNEENLLNDRKYAKDLCFELNNTPPSKSEERNAILQKLLGKCGEETIIESNFFCDYGYNISVGKNFFANYNCVILDCAPVKFGDNVLIGPGCGFYTAIHPIDAEERSTLLESAKPITVGNDVWFGGNVTVLPGVTIGSNVVIGAGSVVTKNIPSNVVVVGNPCKVIRTLED